MPLDAVPPELLTQFFAQAAVANNLAPVVLSHVCQKWRQVAISDPSLWSTIQIQFEGGKGGRNYLLTRVMLERSQNCPLVITVAEWYNRLELSLMDAHIAIKLANLLAKHSHRWKSLSYTGSTIRGAGYLTRLFQKSAPLLQNLSIQTIGGYSDAVEPAAISYFLESAPSLSTLSLRLETHEGGYSHLAFSSPHECLTQLMLKDWHSAQALLELLRHCTSLQHLSLVNLSAKSDSPFILATSATSATSIQLPHLRKIYVFQHTMDTSLSTLFGNITCPSLSHLSISSGFVESIGWPCGAFVDFLRRSSCSLTDLLLERVQITENHLIRFLEECSSTLGSLEIIEDRDIFCISDDILSKLKIDKKDQDALQSVCTTLCPRLHTFCVRDAVRCQDRALYEFLSSRTFGNLEQWACTRCTPLKDVKIRVRNKFRASLAVDVEYLKANGHWVR